MFKKIILLCLVLSLLITGTLPALAVDPVEYCTFHSVDELIEWINTAKAEDGEEFAAWYPFLRAARLQSELRVAVSASEEYTLKEILVPAGQDNMQFFYENGTHKFMVYIELPGTVDKPKASLSERVAKMNEELALAYEGVQYTALTYPGIDKPTGEYILDGGEYQKKDSEDTEVLAPTKISSWLDYTIMIQGIGDLYGTKWDNEAYYGLFRTKTVELNPDEIYRLDLTEKFTDEAFRNFVYAKIGKEPGEPIYDTDIANIREIDIHNRADELRVYSLAGIEYFAGLERLEVTNCKITELDVSMLKQLKRLAVYWCRSLTSLKANGLEKLTGLSCYDNGLTELQVSAPSLIYIHATDNQLSELDLSGCPALEELYISRNNLKTLDITPCPKLRTLSFSGNLFEDTSAIIGYEGRDLWDGSIKIEPTEPELIILPLLDVSQTDWFYDAVQYTFENGLMTGVADYLFAPKETLSRAMVATVLYRLAGEPEAKGDNPFPDVEAGQWYSDAVIWAADEKIVEGYGNGSFGPNDPVTREQLVTMFWRTRGCPEASADVLSGFSDAAEISSWAVDAFAWAVDRGHIQGKPGGTLDPQGTTTRAELAQILMNHA